MTAPPASAEAKADAKRKGTQSSPLLSLFRFKLHSKKDETSSSVGSPIIHSDPVPHGFRKVSSPRLQNSHPSSPFAASGPHFVDASDTRHPQTRPEETERCPLYNHSLTLLQLSTSRRLAPSSAHSSRSSDGGGALAEVTALHRFRPMKRPSGLLTGRVHAAPETEKRGGAIRDWLQETQSYSKGLSDSSHLSRDLTEEGEVCVK